MIPSNVIGLDQSHEEHRNQTQHSLLTSALVCARQRRAHHKDFGMTQRSQVSADVSFKALIIIRYIFTHFSSRCLKKTIGTNPVKQSFTREAQVNQEM